MSHRNVRRQHIQRVFWWYYRKAGEAKKCHQNVGQQDAGTPSWSAFDADPTGSTVLNLQNLNINLNIPVMRKNGAFPFRFALYGNSNYYKNGSSTWATGLSNGPQGAANGIMGWNDLDVGVYYGSAAPAYCPGTNNPTTIYGNYYLQLADGTSHPLPLADHLDSAGCLYTSFTGTTIDGSGYTVSAGSTVSIYDKNGDSIAISQTGAPSLTDSNNNAISLSVTTGVFTDTLGLTPLTMTGGGITTGTYTWTGPITSEQVAVTATTYTALRSAFGCSGITDINLASWPLSTGISFPDGTSMTLAYEATPGYPNDRTGRLTTLKLRSGGTVVFGYPGTSANNYGMNCTYQIPNSMTRTTADGQWTYTLNFFAIGSEEGETDTVLDPGKNKKVYTFTGIGSTASLQGYTPTLTKVQYYANTGTVASPSYSSTPTKQVIYCYGDGPSPSSTTISGCPNALLTLPVTQLTTFTTLGGMTTSAETYTLYDAYGNTTLSEKVDYSSTSGGTPLIATTTVYGSWSGSACVAVNSAGPSGVSTINNKPCTIITKQSSNTVTSSRFTYSATGNVTYVYVSPNGGSSFLSNTTANGYNSNGSPSVLYDLANTPTTYSYNSSYYTNCSSCTNFPFATASTKGALTTYAYYNGAGGVKTEDVDVNGNKMYYYYESTSPNCSSGTGDPWWRITCVQDPNLNQVFKTYSVTNVASAFAFNSGSVNNIAATLDWAGRQVLIQKQQGPSSSNYDTTQNAPSWSGVTFTLGNAVPCTSTLNTYCGYTDTQYVDGLGRLVEHSNTGGGYAIVTYNQNDVLTVLGPPSPSENSKQVQNQYNGVGWLTSSCAISSTVSGNTACSAQLGSYKGVYTTTTYTSATGGRTVSSTRGSQTRSRTYDGLGRVTKKQTPEGGTWNYYYDSSSCTGGGASPGNLTCSSDPNGNSILYFYDSLNRMTYEGFQSGSGLTCRRFYYDNSTGYLGSLPTGVSLANQYGRLVEAETDNCSATHSSANQITDEWFSYDKNGNVTDMWELTPHSTEYYHSKATFYGNGAVNTLQLAQPSEFTMTYGLDGEGRWNALSKGSTKLIPASGVTFNAASRPTNISIGTGTDNDAYTYDANTGRMTGYDFTVNSVSETGILTWNPNSSLKSLAITDGFNSGGTQTCSFNSSLVAGTGYDDIGRLVGSSCGPSGSLWNQSDSYDQYDNLTKSSTGFVSWNPGYSSSTNHYTCTGCTYDANGNVINDGTNTYAWSQFSKMQSVNSSGTNCSTGGTCLVYDALGRAVEIDTGSTHTEIWYTQLGKTVFMNGTAMMYSYWAAPGGGTILYNGNSYYMHKDWLGNARIVSLISSSPSVLTDRAYAPYGEVYDIFGSTGQDQTMFTGDTQDVLAGMYDTPNRELQGSHQGRWLSPDPAGMGWNQYAYATNPNSLTDPSGLGDEKYGNGCQEENDCYPDEWYYPETPYNSAAACSGDCGDEALYTGIDGPLFTFYTNTAVGGLDLVSTDNDIPIYGIFGGSGAEVLGQIGALSKAPYQALSVVFYAETAVLGGGSFLGAGDAALDLSVGSTISDASVVSNGATSVFWSGGAEAEAAATEWAAANNGVTLGMTQAGQDVATATQGMDWTAAQPMWNAVSQDFAANASGNVQAFVSSSASPNSIFFQTELPTLLENPSVTSVTITF